MRTPKVILLAALCSAAFTNADAQASVKAKPITTKSAAAKPTAAVKAAPVATEKKADSLPAVPVKTLPSINLDKYLSNSSEEAAIKEIDGLYANTRFNSIENIENVLYNRKFNLVYHLIQSYGVTPDVNYLYHLNKYDFVCGVGLKRTKDVSPACAQPRVYQTNPDSENKVKLAGLILQKGVQADYLSVARCISKNEVELFKVLYLNLQQTKPDAVNGERLLVDAADAGTLDIVKFLLDQNVSANATDRPTAPQDSKFYALYRSVKYPEIFTLLVEKGADIRVKGYGSTTPIIHAAREGCIEVLQYLLQQGVDPYEVQGNMSAYDMAKKFNEKNKKEVLELFKKAKAK